MAATRLTSDSSASDSSPTEPVRPYALAFSAIVSTAAAMESQAKERECRAVGCHRSSRYRYEPLSRYPWIIPVQAHKGTAVFVFSWHLEISDCDLPPLDIIPPGVQAALLAHVPLRPL